MPTAPPRTYFDHAATSWPKDPDVVQAVSDFTRDVGAAAGRGGYRSARRADAVVDRLRSDIAKLVGHDTPSSVTFHANGTAALNAALAGVLRPGDHVVTTAAEHNSVLRPLYAMAVDGTVDVTVVPTDRGGRVDPAVLLGSVTPRTALVAVTHASNVTGQVQPIAEIGQAVAGNNRALFLVDASQTFGAIPVDLRHDGIDLLAAAGHKASGGPLGTAFLALSAAAADRIRPTIHGGSGRRSESLAMPDELPTMLEPGNLNVPALAGWQVAVAKLSREGLASREQQHTDVATRVKRALEDLPGTRFVLRGDRLPVACIAHRSVGADTMAAILDVEFGIEARAGLHCAPLIHLGLFGDPPAAGSIQDWHAASTAVPATPRDTLRISAGRCTSAADVKILADGMQAMMLELEEI